MRFHKNESRYRKLVTNWAFPSHIVEAYRTLRTNIQFASVDKQIKSILFTSTGAGEGKTTTSANLAIAMAKDLKRTVYIDTDLRKPAGHLIFNLSNRAGVTHYLVGQSALEEVIQETGIPLLSAVTSGAIPPNPAELLGSNRMSAFLDELERLFDVIILDSPPLLVTDGFLLSQKVDGCILVIDAKKTKREQAVKAVEQLKHAHANILGVVLNNEKRVKGSTYEYYYATPVKPTGGGMYEEQG